MVAERKENNNIKKIPKFAAVSPPLFSLFLLSLSLPVFSCFFVIKVFVVEIHFSEIFQFSCVCLCAACLPLSLLFLLYFSLCIFLSLPLFFSFFTPLSLFLSLLAAHLFYCPHGVAHFSSFNLHSSYTSLPVNCLSNCLPSPLSLPFSRSLPVPSSVPLLCCRSFF